MSATPGLPDDQDDQDAADVPPLEPVTESDTMRRLRAETRRLNALALRQDWH